MPIPKSIAALTATVMLDPPVLLDIVEAEITLDEQRTPYAEARLTGHLPAEIEDIDPRLDPAPRVMLTATLSWDEPTRAPQERTFDLLLHARTIDQDAATVMLVCESDEALLIDGGNATALVDTSAEEHQESLRAIIEAVLDEHDATLEPGTEDADFTITRNAVNLAFNPRGFSSSSPWAGSNSSVSRLTGLSIPGLPGVGTALRATATVSSAGGLYFPGDISSPYVPVAAGKDYRVSAWMRSSVTRTFAPKVQWSGAATSTLPAVTLIAGVWAKVDYTITAPAGATRMGPFWYIDAWTTGNTLDLTGLMITEGLDEVDYFDGDTTTDDYYVYAWQSTPHASRSTRTRLDNRSPTLLQLEPGEARYDLLEPLLRTAGLRLWCDEQRVWRLTAPAPTTDGVVMVTAAVNATRGTDTVSLQATRADGAPTWYTGAAVVYTWKDDLGVQQTAYDAAGTGRKVARFTVNRPYPGPGEAATRLALAQGRGRVQDLEALADLTTTPGMILVATLPGTPIQVGNVSAVTWYWAAEGDRHDVMAVRSRGLTDTPDTAWLLAEGTWDDVAGIGWDDITTGGQ